MYAHLVHLSVLVRAVARAPTGIGPARSSSGSFFVFCSTGRGTEHIHVYAHYCSGPAVCSVCFIAFAHELRVICIKKVNMGGHISRQTIRTKTTGITQRPGTIRASSPLWRFSNITRVTFARWCRALALQVHSVTPSNHGNATHTSLSILVLASADRASNRPCHRASATSGCCCSRQTCGERALGANDLHVFLSSTAIRSCLSAPLTCASGHV